MPLNSLSYPSFPYEEIEEIRFFSKQGNLAVLSAIHPVVPRDTVQSLSYIIDINREHGRSSMIVLKDLS